MVLRSPRLFEIEQNEKLAIEEASRILLRGGLVAFPTDTVYGLGCDPFNSDAVRRLMLAKNRQKGELPVLVDSYETANRLGRLGKASGLIAHTFWPGQLTLVVPALAPFPPEVAPNGLVGLRVPDRSDTLAFIRACRGSIVGTSANISGRPSPTSAKAVMQQLGERVDVILDGGLSTIGVESTVLKVSEDRVVLVREAAISRERILNLCPSIVFS